MGSFVVLNMGKGESGRVIVPKCCFCIDLKTGVLVLGILSSIFTGISSIVYLVIFVLRLMNKKTEMDLSDIGFKDEELSTMVNGRLAESILGMIIFVVYFVASILLSVGASKGNSKLLIFWMIVSLVNIVWCIISIKRRSVKRKFKVTNLLDDCKFSEHCLVHHFN